MKNEAKQAYRHAAPDRIPDIPANAQNLRLSTQQCAAPQEPEFEVVKYLELLRHGMDELEALNGRLRDRLICVSYPSPPMQEIGKYDVVTDLGRVLAELLVRLQEQLSYTNSQIARLQI